MLQNHTLANLSKERQAMYERIWDEADYVIPPSENNAFFVMTNVIITPNQTRDKCPEDHFENPKIICNNDKNSTTATTTTKTTISSSTSNISRNYSKNSSLPDKKATDDKQHRCNVKVYRDQHQLRSRYLVNNANKGILNSVKLGTCSVSICGLTSRLLQLKIHTVCIRNFFAYDKHKIYEYVIHFIRCTSYFAYAVQYAGSIFI